MAKSHNLGWVMVRRDDPDFILEYTFCSYRRDAIGELCHIFPTYTRKKILRTWKPVKARRIIVTYNRV